MGPRCRFYPYLYYCDPIGLLGTGFMQVFYFGRAPHTKETLPDFLKWRRVTDELKSHLFLVHFSVCFSFKNE